MAITVETRTKIVELTVGMVGAAPGAAILSELAEVVDAGLSLNDLAIAIANNPAFKVLYPSFLTSEEFATNFLTALMGAEVDATTLSTSIDAMVADLNSGSHRGAAMYTAISTLSATAETDANFGAAAAALNNKTEVAVHYSVTTQQSSDSLDDLIAVVSSVNSTQASVDAAKAVVDGTDNQGQTFTLTGTADNLKGTGGNDTFVAVLDGTTATNTTLSAADTINGGDGTDTLSITLQGAATAAVPSATTSNLESVVVRNVSGGATTAAVSGFTGATSFTNNLSTADVTFNGIGTTQSVSIVGNDIALHGATNIVLSSATSNTLNISGGVGQGAIAYTAGDFTSALTINTSGGTATSTTAANQVGGISMAAGVVTTLDTVTINAATSFTTTGITGFDVSGTDANKGKIIVTGAGAVNLGGLEAAVESVDASAATGGTTFTASTQTDFTFVGGSGNDRVTTAATLVTGASVNAGAGTDDRLIVVESAHIDATAGALYSGFESVEVGTAASTGAVTVSLAQLATNNTITSLRVNPAAFAVTVNSLSATQAAAVTVTGGGHALTLGVTGASTVGQIDTVKLASSSSTTARDVGALGLAGVEKLETTNITITALTSATALDSIKISGGAAQSITSGAITPNVNTVIDGSAATGVLTLNFGGIAVADTNPMLIKGGSAADIITTSGETDDVVNGGAGIDTITVTDGGNGATKFADVQSDALTSADGDVITGFVSGSNDFDYNGALVNGTGAGAGIAATEIASAATITAALATGDAANDIVFIATTTVAGPEDAALTAHLAAPTATTADAVIAALIAAGGALNGAIANLDTVLGAGDSVLFQISTTAGGDTMLLRITNTDQSVANTLIASEVQLVAAFNNTAALVAGDYL